MAADYLSRVDALEVDDLSAPNLNQWLGLSRQMTTGSVSTVKSGIHREQRKDPDVASFLSEGKFPSSSDWNKSNLTWKLKKFRESALHA